MGILNYLPLIAAGFFVAFIVAVPPSEFMCAYPDVTSAASQFVRPMLDLVQTGITGFQELIFGPSPFSDIVIPELSVEEHQQLRGLYCSAIDN